MTTLKRVRAKLEAQLKELRPKVHSETRSIRFTEKQQAFIQSKANKLTRGNFSRYVVYASLKFEPKTEDFERDES